MPGILKQGTKGEENFGPLTLEYEITGDGISWEILGRETLINGPRLHGYLKYKGWNRLQVVSHDEVMERIMKIDSSPANFTCYVQDWPHLKEALDFVYYELGKKIAHGSGYYKSFLKPEELEMVEAIE